MRINKIFRAYTKNALCILKKSTCIREKKKKRKSKITKRNKYLLRQVHLCPLRHRASHAQRVPLLCQDEKLQERQTQMLIT